MFSIRQGHRNMWICKHLNERAPAEHEMASNVRGGNSPK